MFFTLNLASFSSIFIESRLLQLFLLKKHIFYNIKLFSFIFFNTLFYNQSMSLF